jgi:hypothetical protein
MQILHQQPFHTLVMIPLGDFLFEDTGTLLVQHFIRLDVDAP